MSTVQGLSLGLVVGAAVAGAIAYTALAPASDPTLDPAASGAAPTVAVPAAELEALRAKAAESERLAGRLSAVDAAARAAVQAEIDTLTQEAQTLRAEREQLRAEVARLRSSAGATAAGPEVGADLARDRFRFGLQGTTPTFDAADWKTLGGHMAALAEVIADLRDSIAAGRELDMATRQKLIEHNSPLAAFALKAAAELGGTGPNGAYTHPAVMAQLLRAALANAGQPLSAEQETTIATAGNAWVADMDRLQGGYTDATLALQKSVDEADAKQRFLDRVRQALTAAQQAILFPPTTAGRAQLDLLSPALIYAMRMPLLRPTREALELGLTEQLLAAAGRRDAEPAAYVHLATAWLDALPGALVPRAGNDPDVLFPLLADIQAAARAQLTAMEHLLALGELSDTEAAALRANTTLVMPQLQKPG